ncbi:acetylxylan esterase [Kiritimatiellota bacterium B12222]|nr:acetylxylan esterase [Kiritimatiellota bacterium B12222]
MNPPIITDESQVLPYDLPALCLPETSKENWSQRRKQLLALFSDHVYGRTPALLPDISPRVKLIESAEVSLPTLALRRQFRISFSDAYFNLLMYSPLEPASGSALFLGLNFAGNHTISPDSAILLPTGWVSDIAETYPENHRATDAGRGTRSRRWPVAEILRRGHTLATLHCSDLAPDQPEHPQINAFKSLFQTSPDPDATWGNIGIWAWSLSRALDLIETLPEFKSSRVWALGHSRLGKTALWAAAQDPRFYGAVSNNSGCLGAAISRRCFGETIDLILGNFPHWFCPRLLQYAHREADMPLDQHMLLALLAPRPLYVSSASEDLWADPRGEFLSTLAASDAWCLHGYRGLEPGTPPPAVGSPLHHERMGYHIRQGPHDILASDWNHFMNFAESY